MKKPSIGRLTWKGERFDSWSTEHRSALNHNGEKVGRVSGKDSRWSWNASEDRERGIVGAQGETLSEELAKAACVAHVRRCLELNVAPDAERERLRAGVEVAETQKRWANAALEQAKDVAATAREQERAAREALTAYLEARLKGEGQG